MMMMQKDGPKQVHLSPNDDDNLMKDSQGKSSQFLIGKFLWKSKTKFQLPIIYTRHTYCVQCAYASNASYQFLIDSIRIKPFHQTNQDLHGFFEFLF